MESSLLPVAMLLLGGGGIGTLLGLLIQRQNNNMVNSATLISHAMTGLKDIADERAADLAACRAEKEQLRAENAGLRAQLRRRGK